MAGMDADARGGPPAGWEGRVVLRTEGLTKRYGRRASVDGLSIEVRRGEVFGLLGPNGAGKTTTLRMLLGLVRPSAGRIECFGMDLSRPASRRVVLGRIGALIEQPGFYDYLSGWENLCGVATVSGMPTGKETRARVQAALVLVGLAERARDPYRTYSLGMKQRLGIAAALLGGPDLVVLDEPTNGLDPAGVVEVRALISRLGESGVTVLLSSHLLGEVQQLCTRVAILKAGTAIAQGRVSELLTGGDALQIAFSQPGDLPRAQTALQEAAAEHGARWLGSPTFAEAEPGEPAPPGGWYLLVPAPPERTADVTHLLAAKGLYPTEVRRRGASLEHFFLTLTAKEPPAPPADRSAIAESAHSGAAPGGTP